MPDRSPLQRAALAYCAPRGIPLSVFLGRVVHPGEPQWTDDDVVAALEWQADENLRCTGCGRNTSETTSIDAEDSYSVEGIRCHACKVMADEAEAFRKDGGSLAGMRWRVTQLEAT